MRGKLREIINRKTSNPLIIMMCGVAGSGKTTYAQQLEKEGFVRLSIDEEIWKVNGRYGIDYPAEKYSDDVVVHAPIVTSPDSRHICKLRPSCL
jgi:septin family protein